MNANAESATGFEALKKHVIENKINVALWFTRALTLFFSFFYLIPIFWNSQNAYYKALAAYATTSALRLHQRQPCIRLNMQFLASVLMEDSCHYLIYSMIFLYVAPFTLVLIPIACFSLIHFASYSLRLLDVLGSNSLWVARLLISLVEFKARTILHLIAITEIILMPLCVIFFFTGRASFFTPFMYHRFLLMRCESQRNPSTRNMLAELHYSANTLANNPRTPHFIKTAINYIIMMVGWMGRPSLFQPAPQQ